MTACKQHTSLPVIGYHSCVGCEIEALREERDRYAAESERWERYAKVLEEDKKALTESHVLYTWLRKKCAQAGSDVVAVYMNIGHDWAEISDLDRDLRAMIEAEEP